MTKTLALVTCCYDLVKRGSAEHRSVEWLLDNSAFVLDLDHELVIFTDPELADAVRARRGVRPTTIVAVPFEELLRPDRAAAALSGARPRDANAAKDTPPYVQLMWSRYAMLEGALAISRASHLGWIDLAITHVAKLPPVGVDVFADPSDRVRVHVLRCFGRSDVDHPDYLRRRQGHLAGGLFLGARVHVKELIDDFWDALDRAISMAIAPLDEGLLAYVVGQRSEDFTYSYGDYEDILRNHDAPRGGETHRRWIAEDARSRGLPEVMGPCNGQSDRYVFDPVRGSARIVGSPAVILGYRAEESPHIVPGRYERDLVDWALQLVSDDEQFVDCGAHMGSWTLVMAPRVREVHAFEPQRLIFQQLCGNVALSGLTNVFARNVGLDETVAQLTLQCPGIDRGSSSARVDVARRLEAQRVLLSPETIDVVPLDQFAAVLTDVGLVKIDVEGLELRVLRGATRVLRENDLPKLIVECWSDDWYRQDKEALLRFLDDLGYRVVQISGYPDVLLAEKK